MTEPEKQDYRKDTLCTADIFEEKDCTGNALEKDLGLMRGGLLKYFRNNPDNVILRIK